MSTGERPGRTTTASSATSNSPDKALASRIWIPQFQEHALRELWGASRSSIDEPKPTVLPKSTPVKFQMLRDFAGALCFSLCSAYTVIAGFHVDQWNCLCSGSSIALAMSGPTRRDESPLRAFVGALVGALRLEADSATRLKPRCRLIEPLVGLEDILPALRRTGDGQRQRVCSLAAERVAMTPIHIER